MKRCLWCGKEYTDEAEVCSIDGNSLERVEKTDAREKVLTADSQNRGPILLKQEHIALSVMVLVFLRMQCLVLLIYGFRLFLESLIWSSNTGGTRNPKSIAIVIFTSVLAVAFWQLSPWLARLLLGKRDVSVPITGLTLRDLYCFAFVLLGLYFALSSLAPALTWAHYTFVVAAQSAGPNLEERRSLYSLLQPAITFAAGLICILKGPMWARKLLQKDGMAEPSAAPNGGPAASVENSSALGGPPSVS